MRGAAQEKKSAAKFKPTKGRTNLKRKIQRRPEATSSRFVDAFGGTKYTHGGI